MVRPVKKREKSEEMGVGLEDDRAKAKVDGEAKREQQAATIHSRYTKRVNEQIRSLKRIVPSIERGDERWNKESAKWSEMGK
jgi:hypothetical protein